MGSCNLRIAPCNLQGFRKSRFYGLGLNKLTLIVLRTVGQIGMVIANSVGRDALAERGGVIPRSASARLTTIREELMMNLTIWLPALFALGLAAMALMFAFVHGCDKV